MAPAAEKPCPKCGAQGAELEEQKGARFPFRVKCAACGWSTPRTMYEMVAWMRWGKPPRY